IFQILQSFALQVEQNLDSQCRAADNMIAWELEYRSTFIDVKEDSREERVRSNSCPAPRRLRDTVQLAAYEVEEQMKGYVNDLNFRGEEIGEIGTVTGGVVEQHEEEAEVEANEVASTKDEDEAVDAVVTGDEAEEGVEIVGSIGSYGHPEVCRRRCVHFLRGFCQSGLDCNYCHLPHPAHEAKLDKKQRGLLDGLSKAQLLGTALTFLYRRAQQKEILEAARPILAIYEQEAVHGVAENQRIKKLDKVMGRMSFGALLSLSSHRLGEDFHRRVTEAEETLRF
ncbi:unnamed protein product, partial [Cladocopium goreaui]